MKQLKHTPQQLFALIVSATLLTACTPTNLKQVHNDKQETEAVLQSAGLQVASVEDAMLKAEKAAQNGKMDLAQLYFIKAYELEPANSQVLQKMTDLYTELKKYELAEVSLKLLLKQQPEDLSLAEQYGLLLIKRGNYPDAEQQLGRVVAKQQSWVAYNGLGIIANAQDQALKAEGLFKKADSLYPNSPELLNNIGFSLYSADKLEEAEVYYRKALQLNPEFKKAIYNYALLQARYRRYDQAYNAFAKVSTPSVANNNTGYIAMMNGDYPEANTYLQEAVKSSPLFYKKANDNLMRLELLEK